MISNFDCAVCSGTGKVVKDMSRIDDIVSHQTCKVCHGSGLVDKAIIESDTRPRFSKYYPNFMKPTIFTFGTKKELFKHSSVYPYGLAARSNFYAWGAQFTKDRNGNLVVPLEFTLFALYDYNAEFLGAQDAWMVGTVTNAPLNLLGIEYYEALIATHKPDCWTRKYRSIEHDLLNSGRSEKERLRTARSLGWKYDDFMGIAVSCDCGYEKLMKELRGK